MSPDFGLIYFYRLLSLIATFSPSVLRAAQGSPYVGYSPVAAIIEIDGPVARSMIGKYVSTAHGS